MTIAKYIAIYVRVSTLKQDARSQEPDLLRWIEAFANGAEVKWYRDKASGKTMDRPGWRKLEEEIEAGKVAKVVCWRLDRLGRTASGLTTLFDSLRSRGIGLVSVKDSLDLGRLMANVLASVAAYENEVHSERIVAGQEVARANGKRWGGRKAGHRVKVNDDQVETIRRLYAEKKPIAAIARTVALSRPTIYHVLRSGRNSSV